MARLTSTGQASTGYGAYWFDDTRTILQDCSSGVCKLCLSDGTPISDRGNRIHLEARGGLWVSQDASGVYGSWGDFAGAAIASGPSPVASELIGPDGSLIYKVRYFSAGPWFNTATHSEIPGDGDSWQNLGGGKFIVRRGMDIVDQDGRVLGRGWWPRLKDGRLLHQAETGELVLDGRAVMPPSASYFRPDFLVRPDGSVLIVWSSNEGETDVQSQTFTAAQFAALPLVGATVPKPPPPPPPVTPEPKPLTNHLDIVQRERAKYGPIITDAECFAITNAVAANPAVAADGWGLTKAPAGGHGYVANGQNYRVDKLSNRADGGRICDILGSSGTGAASAGWSDGLDPAGLSSWAPPISFTPPTPPTTGGGTVDTGGGSSSGAPGAALDAALASMTARFDAALAKIAALESRLAAVEVRPVSIPTAVVFDPQVLNGVKIALHTALGKVVCEDRDHPAVDGSAALLANRDSAGGWETFTVEVK